MCPPTADEESPPSASRCIDHQSSGDAALLQVGFSCHYWYRAC